VTTNAGSGLPSTDPNAPPPRSSAILGVALTAALTTLLLGLLFYRSLVTPVPSSKLIVRADDSWASVRLIITGGGLSEPRETGIVPLGGYIVPFYLDPGVYTLHVRDPRSDADLYSRQVELGANSVEEIDLTELVGTTRPSTTSTALPNAGA
jgi:hypothetical protein